MLFNSLIFSDGKSEYTRNISKNYTDIVNVSNIYDTNSRASFTPLNIFGKCCWECVSSQSGYVKENIGLLECHKCQDLIQNTYKTQCMQFSYNYFSINSEQKVLVTVWSLLGCLYALFYFLVFLFYKITPLFKSPNSLLSLIQISLYLVLTGALAPCYNESDM